jgi:tetratricopeptide (TPR) repeat protein
MPARDNFKQAVVRILANRAGHRCSNPDCRRETSGPQLTNGGSVNIGVAAHISAAAPGGPRFDPEKSQAARSSAANGIWLCQSCAKLVDSDEEHFTIALLLNWKTAAEHLARSRLHTPARPQIDDEPILFIPSTDPAVSWLPFSARSTAFVGRDTEVAKLADFLNSDRKFSWWLITGAAGTGKSRLVLEFCLNAKPAWNAGFLSRVENFTQWSHFRPPLPTLIVLDYVRSRVTYATSMILQLSRSTAYFPSPVRVLFVERDRGSWWPRFFRDESLSESTEMLACQYDEPLHLEGLAPEALRALAAQVARSRNRPWTDSISRAFERRMRMLDPFNRPLFGMMAVDHPGNEAIDSVVDSTLLRLVLKKEAGRRREVVSDEDRLGRMENLVTLATLVGGLMPRSGGFNFLADTKVAQFLPDPACIDPHSYGDFVATMSPDAILAGLQPDILGERFVLDRLSAVAGADANAKRLVQVAWTLQPEDLCDFIVRAASDFPGDAALDALCDLALDSGEARESWGRLVGELVHVANRSTDRTAKRLLAELRELADRHADESGLQRALALAELNLANILLMSEQDLAGASIQFEAAIARAGPGSEIEAAAINNRGILHHRVEDEDNAFADWTNVISKDGISEEARACSLNNRADIYERRGSHDGAIRDRSEVLELRETSANRRYIALIGRSSSYLKLGRTGDALRDIEQILGTEDITQEQQAEARMFRGAILMRLRRFEDARNEFEAALAIEHVFPGTAADALVALADLARLERNVARAREYVEMALSAVDIDGRTLVEALIVSARLLMEEGETARAENVWQSVIANPNATVRQRAIASTRGEAQSLDWS